MNFSDKTNWPSFKKVQTKRKQTRKRSFLADKYIEPEFNHEMKTQLFNQKLLNPISGFSLVELLTAVAIFSVLAAVGLPYLADNVEENKVGSRTKDLFRITNLARSSAINESRLIVVCPTTEVDDKMNSISCSAQGQYLVSFRTSALDDAPNFDNEGIIRVADMGNMGTAIMSPFDVNSGAIIFQADGNTFNGGMNGSITFCPNNSDIEIEHDVVVSRVGRVRIREIEQSSEDDGQDNGDVSC